ncbi:LrgB family protein [Treponema sp.]|uniref:LrgB family protein n=1 Tax=Treponema sp. TaxID=166 RepID=UPI003F04280C
MSAFLVNSVYFGVFLTLVSYAVGIAVNRKTHFFLFSPLIVSIVLCIAALMALKIPYEIYASGANFISCLLTPATVCLAIPLYEQVEKLKENWLAVLAGILCGVAVNLLLIFLLCLAFGIGHTEYVSLLGKSITTAIALGITEELHGIVPVIVVMVVLTGNLGNLFAVQICRVFRITDPVAKGVAIGTSSHALGTSKAVEIGEVEGAMSGLSIGIAGILTVILAPVFAGLI